MKKQIGKFLLDLSKILFGTAFLGSFLQGGFSKPIIGLVSGFVFFGLVIFGFFLIRKK